MQQMPYQKYQCPTCHDTMETRSIYPALCSNEGCKWINMRPVTHSNNCRTAGWLIAIVSIAFIVAVRLAS